MQLLQNLARHVEYICFSIDLFEPCCVGGVQGRFLRPIIHLQHRVILDHTKSHVYIVPQFFGGVSLISYKKETNKCGCGMLGDITNDA